MLSSGHFYKLKNMTKIVFVEDDPEVGKLIAAYLGKHDIDVFVEPRGDTAQAVIEHQQPDLVLLDVMLPLQRWDDTLP